MTTRRLASTRRVDECAERAIELLLRNLAPAGILAATRTPDAVARGYVAVFGRDAAVCALGMAVSGNATLEREAATGLLTLARHQARNGQIPKFVDVQAEEADFWYLGCIDATLWWLIALATSTTNAMGFASGSRRTSSARSRGSNARSINASTCCSRTRRATGRT